MKKKQWEPVAIKCYGGTFEGELMVTVSPDKLSSAWTPVRIIREKDYQKLLRLARKAKRTP